MADLREELIRSFGDGFDKKAEQMLNSNFLANKDSWVKSATDDYVRYNVDPNQSLVKIATDYNLNDEQVKRLVEETNTSIYLRKYASLKGDNKRDIVFPLADFNKIRPGIEQVKAATIYYGAGTMEKAASVQKDTKSAVNCFNSYESYEPSLWDNIDKTAMEISRRTMLASIKEELKDRQDYEKSFLNKVATIGNALIYKARIGESPQALLDKIAADADFYGSYQVPVLRFVENYVALQKEASRLPDNFHVDLAFSTKVEENPYSLGKHSLLEKAGSDVVINVDKFPENMNYDQLVIFAKTLKEELDKNPPRNTFKPIKVDEVM